MELRPGGQRSREGFAPFPCRKNTGSIRAGAFAGSKGSGPRSDNKRGALLAIRKKQEYRKNAAISETTRPFISNLIM